MKERIAFGALICVKGADRRERVKRNKGYASPSNVDCELDKCDDEESDEPEDGADDEPSLGSDELPGGGASYVFERSRDRSLDCEGDEHDGRERRWRGRRLRQRGRRRRRAQPRQHGHHQSGGIVIWWHL
jgi:hypothetical protein